MNEKEIISKIESLKEIKPDSNWAFSARKDIFEKKEKDFFSFLAFPKTQTAFSAALLLVVGIFAFFQYTIFLENAEEMERIAKEKEIEMLSVALNELKETKADLKKEFAQSVQSKTKEEAVEVAKSFAPSILEIEEEEDFLTDTLGATTEDEASPSAAKDVALLLIEDYKERSLTEEDQELLEKAENAFENKEYRTSLKTVLKIRQERDGEEDKEKEE